MTHQLNYIAAGRDSAYNGLWVAARWLVFGWFLANVVACLYLMYLWDANRITGTQYATNTGLCVSLVLLSIPIAKQLGQSTGHDDDD